MIESAKLLGVIPVKLEYLSPSLLAYDTDNGVYQLPKKGDYLMLIFQKIHGVDFTVGENLFTTLRRSTPEKIRYYSGAIGEEFKVEIVAG